MIEKTELAVTRPMIADAMGIGLTSLNVLLAVAGTDDVKARQYQKAPRGVLKHIYNLDRMDAFLRRVCPDRYTDACAARLKAESFEVRLH